MSEIFHLTGQLRGAELSEVWVVDGRITYQLPPGSYPVCELSGYVYPGLLDAHTHPGLTHTPQPPTDEDILQRLETHRSLGVTQIKDCGGQRNPNEVRRVGDPKVIHCGQHMARPRRYLRYLAVEIEPADLPRVALQQLAGSDGWVKLVGDWIDRSLAADADLLPLWPREVLVDAVAGVHEAGGKVTVHTFARETIDDLLVAGVDAIEHGTGMTADHLQEAKRRGIVLTPTVRQISEFPWYAAQASKYPVYARRMMRMAYHQREHLELVVDSGVPLVMGSDSSVNLTEKNLAVELCYAVAAGMPAEVVMSAASFGGRAALGLPTWQEGAPADFVVYARDPERDITEVTRPITVLVDGHEHPLTSIS